MKTKEFIKKVKSLGFEVEDGYDRKGELVELRIGDGEEDFVVIWPKFTFAISTIEDGFTDFKYSLPLKELYKLCFEYASTPVEDREEEKKFYLRHRLIQTDGCYMYLQKTSDDADMMSVRIFGSKDDSDLKFTLKEIEEIMKKFNTDLKDFDLVEGKR